ncbi:MAG: ABC transporter permease [Anaerolineae bacterium]
MSIISTGAVIASGREQSARMPFLLQVSALTWRNLVVVFRTPAELLPSIFISIFFVLVYKDLLSGAAAFFLPGQDYLGFVLPISIVSTALNGAGTAGQAVVRDIESGYFDKLMLTPISRVAIVFGAILSGAIVLMLLTSIVLVTGLLLGLQPATGLAGLLTVLGYSLLLGLGFAGFTVGIALRSGSAGATQGATFLFFPLTFLTATFTPFELLSGWIKTAAQFNPVTYLLEAMRPLLLTGWDTDALLRGFITCLGLAVVTFAFAFFSLQARTKRR